MMRPYDRVLLLFPHPEAGRRGTLAFQRPSGVWSVHLDRGGTAEAGPAFLRLDPYLPPSAPWPFHVPFGSGLRAVAVLYTGMWAQPRYQHLPLDVATYCLAVYPERPSCAPS